MTERQTRTLTGTVISDKADKTIVVLVERRVKHPLYGKYIRRRSKVRVHDENNDCGVGDLVTVAECRPISKTKSWRLQRIDVRAENV
jgi:small subunit ribosomal protein S17